VVETAILPVYFEQIVAAGILAPLSWEWIPTIQRQLHSVLAVFAMAFSSITVVSNSLLLRRARV
jgi:Cu+-exporting ATPase